MCRVFFRTRLAVAEVPQIAVTVERSICESHQLPVHFRFKIRLGVVVDRDKIDVFRTVDAVAVISHQNHRISPRLFISHRRISGERRLDIRAVKNPVVVGRIVDREIFKINCKRRTTFRRICGKIGNRTDRQHRDFRGSDIRTTVVRRRQSQSISTVRRINVRRIFLILHNRTVAKIPGQARCTDRTAFRVNRIVDLVEVEFRRRQITDGNVIGLGFRIGTRRVACRQSDAVRARFAVGENRIFLGTRRGRSAFRHPQEGLGVGGRLILHLHRKVDTARRFCRRKVGGRCGFYGNCHRLGCRRFAAFVACRQRDFVSSVLRVNVRRVGFRACFTVAEIPRKIRRIVGIVCENRRVIFLRKSEIYRRHIVHADKIILRKSVRTRFVFYR